MIACGTDEDDIAWVLGDHSAGGLSPEQWARKVAGAAEKWNADSVSEQSRARPCKWPRRA